MNENIGKPVYIATAGSNQVVCSVPCVLQRVIVGANVANGDIQISDSKTSGSSSVKKKFTGSTLLGSYECGMTFANGITVDQTNQTQVTYVVAPIN